VGGLIGEYRRAAPRARIQSAAMNEPWPGTGVVILELDGVISAAGVTDQSDPGSPDIRQLISRDGFQIGC
jgi:hypothetical protein